MSWLPNHRGDRNKCDSRSRISLVQRGEEIIDANVRAIGRLEIRLSDSVTRKPRSHPRRRWAITTASLYEYEIDRM